VSGEELIQFAEEISTKDDFLKFMKLLIEDFHTNHNQWGNADLPSYLEGLEGFASGMEGYYRNQHKTLNLDSPSWRLFAEMLLAASVYE
jgi:hypothetical protein